MNSISFPSSYLALPPPLRQSTHVQLRLRCYLQYSNGHCLTSLSLQSPFILLHPLHNHRSIQIPICATTPSNEGAISVINSEGIVEKDWSFLETDDTNSDEEHNQKIHRIISAGGIGKTSKVLVSIGSEGFVDRVVNSSPCEQLLIIHDSLFVLACIKEKYDNVKCWQGELIHVPEKWAPFDVVFLYFFPALPFVLGQVFGALALHCLPGARLVISHHQGRQVVEQQQKQYPDVVISDLPDKMTLQNVAAEHSFDMIEFVDEPGFYLAVLKFKAKNLDK